MRQADDKLSVGGCPHLDAYDPASPTHLADPEARWRVLRRDTPVFFSTVQNAFVVTRYQDACEVYGDPSTFSSAGSLMPIRSNPPEIEAILAQGYPQKELGAMIMVDEPRHSELRRPLNPWFAPKQVASYEETIRQLAHELIDRFPATGIIEIVDSFAYPLALGVMLDILGIPPEHSSDIRAWVNQRVALMWGTLELDGHIEAALSFLEFQRYLQGLLDDRRSQPQKDLISQFVRQGEGDGRPLSDIEIVGQMIGFLSAGHEMTTSAITFGVWNLLRNRARWDAAAVDPESLRAVVEETIRHRGPSFSVWRLAVHDTTIGGVPIPAGARISILNGSANLDEEAFEEAEEWNPSRPRANPHLGFGRGVHYCLGAHLARLEVRIALEELARHVPTLRLPEGGRIELYPNVTLRMPRALHLHRDGPGPTSARTRPGHP